ncbi:hypothetical protein E7T06_12035 [Deinococcus sp. Arct2-2]|uniref:hypothetical protein n=1 Tax=Deinococcus sp. Arct2-2 TaxID=2568653 RepID=UPI0010A53E1C|nr:hypothetical protein [Deinococcus sp. Arct2-2]THF69413.1 hypothetical protein E7T06_12035 [Deinococcus sp. Arct2-2]
MKRLLLPLPLMLAACAPAAQPQSAQPQTVHVFEGQATVLLRPQQYRLTLTVNPLTYDAKGVMENRSSGDRFSVAGTLLPTPNGSQELTVKLDANAGPSARFSILGFGLDGLSAKSDAFLSGTIRGELLAGRLRVNALSYPVTLRRVR